MPYSQTSLKLLSLAATALVISILFAGAVIAEAMTFAWEGSGSCNGCTYVAATGIIQPDTPDTYSRFIERNGTPRHLLIDSPGGNLAAGLRLGRQFRRDGIVISVPKGATCISACAYALLGAPFRDVSEGQLGFHQFYDPSGLTDPELQQFTAKDRVLDQIITGRIVQYLSEMQIDLSLYELAASVPPNQIRFLSDLELAKFRISNMEGINQGPWTIEPFGQGVVSQSATYPNYWNPNGGSLRLFCMKNEFFAAFTIKLSPLPTINLDNEENNYLTALPVEFSLSNRSFVPKTQTVIPSAEGNSFAWVFSVEREFFEILQDHGVLEVLNRGPRVDWPRYGLLNVGKIPGDTRAIEIAMKNCVEE